MQHHGHFCSMSRQLHETACNNHKPGCCNLKSWRSRRTRSKSYSYKLISHTICQWQGPQSRVVGVSASAITRLVQDVFREVVCLMPSSAVANKERLHFFKIHGKWNDQVPMSSCTSNSLDRFNTYLELFSSPTITRKGVHRNRSCVYLEFSSSHW